MKKMLWIIPDRQIEFNINFIEYFFLKNIFKKRKYKIKEIKYIEPKGQKINLIICDESANMPLSKIKNYFLGVDFAK